MDLAVQRTNGLSPDFGIAGESGEACIPRPRCHQMDLHSYTLWSHEWTGNIHHNDSQRHSVWKELASKSGLAVGRSVDTKIIVDDILNWSKTFREALQYIICQLKICKAYRLTLSLKKSHFFPKRLEFVGIDVSPDGNRPAMSKHELLKHWPIPVLVCDVASFVGFLQFYSKFIPNFEIRVEPLCTIMARDYTKEVGDLWTPKAQSTFDELRNSILGDPCLQRFDPHKLTVL